MNGNSNVEFSYLAKPAIHVFWGIVGITGAVAFGISGLTNKRALELEGIFLPRQAATVFYWAMCVVLSGLFLLTVNFAIQVRLHPRRISLSEDSVSIPDSRWSSRTTAIPYTTISDLAEIKLRGCGFLYITHASGRTIVTPAGFRSGADYLSFCQLLIERAPGAFGERRQLELLCEQWDPQTPKKPT